MRNVFVIKIIIMSICLFNCTKEKKERSNTSINGLVKEAPVINEGDEKDSVINHINKTVNIDSSKFIKPERYSDFFEKFSDDRNFQLSRILFPLKVSYYDIYDDDQTEDLIAEQDWKFIDFSNDEFARNRETDAYSIEIEYNLNHVNYVRSGVDNGILITYVFVLKNGKWFLTEITDKST